MSRESDNLRYPSPEELLEGLNEPQARAVQSEASALLIVAGAGSGKTRVLTRRIAWILSTYHVPSEQILAITFTNKAAAEMRERLIPLVGSAAQRMWVATFHSACARILRQHGSAIHLPAGFTIYDQSDTERLMKNIMKDLSVNPKEYKPRSILAAISTYKNQLKSASSVCATLAPWYTPGTSSATNNLNSVYDTDVIQAVLYAEYQYRLEMAHAVDFDDLIFKTYDMLRTCRNVADYYHRQFRYILVDEYQDTNVAQYELLRLLAGVDCQYDNDNKLEQVEHSHNTHDGDSANSEPIIAEGEEEDAQNDQSNSSSIALFATNNDNIRSFSLNNSSKNGNARDNDSINHGKPAQDQPTLWDDILDIVNAVPDRQNEVSDNPSADKAHSETEIYNDVDDDEEYLAAIMNSEPDEYSSYDELSYDSGEYSESLNNDLQYNHALPAETAVVEQQEAAQEVANNPLPSVAPALVANASPTNINVGNVGDTSKFTSPYPPVHEPAWVTVVGDSDQSIYAFRGADIRNILNFEQDFPQATSILLEQNYRSTQHILDAANAVIARNKNRKPKRLWTAQGEGEPLVGYAAENAHDEARWIANTIADLQAKNYQYSDIAIMYRMNSLSRAVEDEFIKRGVPYILVGGVRFYERLEIKDVMSYLHAGVNPDDDISIRRILNTPRRGIGSTTETAVASYAQSHNVSFWKALQHLESIDVTPAARKKLAAFVELMQDEIIESCDDPCMTVSEILDTILYSSGLKEYYALSDKENNETRVNNIEQLQTLAVEFEDENPEATILEFLETTSLKTAEQDDHSDSAGSVSLMSLHAAKGLEFPVVFLIGMEEDTFPSYQAVNENNFEEERRLAYVGITRAREKLYLSRSAHSRVAYGQQRNNHSQSLSMGLIPSRFLDEIPRELLQWEREKAPSEELMHEYSSDDDNYDNSWRSSDFGSSYEYDGSSQYGSRKYQYGSSSNWKNKNSFDNSRRSSRVRVQKITGAKSEKIQALQALVSQQEQTSSVQRTAYTIEDFQVGDRIIHDSYGLGKVVDTEKSGKNGILVVDFGSDGTKRLLISKAPIEKV